MPLRIKTDQIRQHEVQHLAEMRQVRMTVMQIVNDAHIGHAFALQFVGDRDHVGRFAKPAAVIVEADAHAELLRPPGRWA